MMFDPVLLLSQAAGSPPLPPWLSAYLDGDGAAYALAAGAMSAVDTAGAKWSWLAIGDTVSSSSYACGSLSNEQLMRIASGGGACRHYANGFVSATPVPSGLAGLIGGTDRAAYETTAQAVFADSDTGIYADFTYTPAGAADAYIGAGGSGSQPYTGPLYVVLVLLGIYPTTADVRALLAGATPDEVWSASALGRCWNFGDVYEDKGSVIVPDTAQAFGGPLSPVNATLQNGSLASIVTV